MSDYRTKTNKALRVLFCIGVQQTFFDEEAGLLPEIIPAIQEAFNDLRGRFGIDAPTRFEQLKRVRQIHSVGVARDDHRLAANGAQRSGRDIVVV